MGGQKQKQTSNQQTSTTTELPAWMTAAGQDLYSKAAKEKPLGAYGGQMTAGQSQNGAMASTAAREGAGAWRPALGQAQDMTTAAAGAGPQTMQAAQQRGVGYQAAGQGGVPQVQAGSVGAGEFGTAEAAKYMNPWQQMVQATTLREMDRGHSMERQGLGDQVQGAKAFGGARHALLESEQRKNQDLARTDYIDRSNADAFSQAQGQFNTDRGARVAAETGNADRSMQAQSTNAGLWEQLMGRTDQASQFTASARNQASGANADRRQEASRNNAGFQESFLDRLMRGGGQVADIAGAGSQLDGADISRLAATGDMDRGIEQEGLDRTYQDWLRAGNAPLDNIKDIMAVLSGAPRNVTTSGTSSGTSVTKTSGGLFNQLLAAGQLGASVFSDPRLKKDVSLIGTLRNGLGVYLYRYLWEPRRSTPHLGVMADEVLRMAPEALGSVVGGFLTVNYRKLLGAI